MLEVIEGMVEVVEVVEDMVVARRGSDQVRSGRWSSFRRTRSHDEVARTSRLMRERRETGGVVEEEEEEISLFGKSWRARASNVIHNAG